MLLTKGIVGVLVAVLGMANVGPAAGVSEEQLEYSKKLFGEGVTAMEAEDYTTALKNFTEAYKYAPHLHVFSFNIAAAADELGDCETARTYYQRFVDLVPEHAKRKSVKAKLKAYGNTCLADADSTEVVTKKSAKKRSEDREVAAAAQAMNETLFQIRVAAALYANGKQRHKKKTKIFNRPAWRKKWDARRMAKLLPKHGIEEEARDMPQPDMPIVKLDACRSARVQENRTIRALEEAREKVDTQEAYRVLTRFLKRAEGDLEKFKACE